MAIGLSALCVVHCVSTALLVVALSSLGGWLVHPAIHEMGLLIAIGLAAASLGRGVARHGLWRPLAVGGVGLGLMATGLAVPHGPLETLFTVVGVAIVAFGHALNRRAFA